jgi:hypothetical protein
MLDGVAKYLSSCVVAVFQDLDIPTYVFAPEKYSALLDENFA